jgi:hypothetical protein
MMTNDFHHQIDFHASKPLTNLIWRGEGRSANYVGQNHERKQNFSPADPGKYFMKCREHACRNDGKESVSIPVDPFHAIETKICVIRTVSITTRYHQKAETMGLLKKQ